MAARQHELSLPTVTVTAAAQAARGVRMCEMASNKAPPPRFLAKVYCNLQFLSDYTDRPQRMLHYSRPLIKNLAMSPSLFRCSWGAAYDTKERVIFDQILQAALGGEENVGV